MANLDQTPGRLLQQLLDERGWTQQVLATILNVDRSSVIGRIVADSRPIEAEMAIALEEIFGVPAEDFLEIQKQFDLARARLISRPDPGRMTRAKLLGDLPITEMVKRGWLKVNDIKNPAEVEQALIKFFGVTSADEIEILPHSSKKTRVNSPVTPVELAWLYRVKQLASDLLVARYSPSSVREAVRRLDALLSAPEEARKVPRIMMEAGIKFVLVETLSSAKIDGVCFWLDDKSPVIGMSLRLDRIDNFWFVLRHEIEHVIRLHGRAAMMIDSDLEGERAGTGSNIAEEERVANEAAADFCVPKQQLDKFIARKSPFFPLRDVLGFARTLQVHPGLVAGQIRHRTGRYELFSRLLVKIRSAVLPGAIVDGWGNIAPVDF